MAEIGVDMSRFPTAGHLASWAGMCRDEQSTGKRITGPLNRGNVWLRSILGEVAWASIKTRRTYFLRSSIALPAVADAIRRRWQLDTARPVVIYQVLRNKQPYTEFGADYLDHLDASRVERHHVHRLEQLGCAVALSPISPCETHRRARVSGELVWLEYAVDLPSTIAQNHGHESLKVTGCGAASFGSAWNTRGPCLAPCDRT